MTKVRVYNLNDPDLPESLHIVKDTFTSSVQPKIEEKAAEIVQDNTRQPGESLHDYLNRKGIRCFCKICKGKNVHSKIQ